LRVVRAGAADIAVLKVAPLGGVRKLLEIAEQIDIPVVISSALDSAVGIANGLHAAAALPDLEHACGLGTGALLMDDVAEPMVPVDGYLPVTPVAPDRARLETLAAPPDRRQWWIDRITVCHRKLVE
jgi:O-succinylbenzoate synthase